MGEDWTKSMYAPIHTKCQNTCAKIINSVYFSIFDQILLMQQIQADTHNKFKFSQRSALNFVNF